MCARGYRVSIIALLLALTSACSELDLEADSKPRAAARDYIQQPQDLAVPAYIKIIPPDRRVPPQYAAFAGKWGGRYQASKVPVLLVVEEVKRSGEVQGAFIWGPLPGTTGTPGGNWRFRAQIEDGKIQFGTKIRLEFKMTSNTSMQGLRFENGLLDGIIEMSRVR